MTGNRKKKILIVAYPKQGSINPSLRFANRLLNLGVDVTFSTSLSVLRRFDKNTTCNGLTLAPFSDGHDDGQQPTTTMEQFISDFATNGVPAVDKIIAATAATAQPFDHLVYTTISPWAAKVADANGLESTLLWCQPAIVLGVYYYYFNGYEALISCNSNNPTFPINLPGLPSLTITDLPSFFLSSSPKEHEIGLQIMKDHIDALRISVPTVAFAQWTDQTTIAKMIVDVWKTGVKVKRREGDGVVEGNEIKRCVKIVMEDGEIRRNAEKWRELARKALNSHGGSSSVNLKAFLDGCLK
ncbi:hypothetical protein SSX86_019696 [Deinandra increscens subsp. villosa]|uniref:Uncharacterized protein n=1 Tax=Deinandra increscens subsp. villosa TaxID=3103831 RepID=A0AAP0CTB0_9ASTR